MGYVIVSPPALEPVTVADLVTKTHLRVDGTDDDNLLTLVYIPAARRHAETLTRRSFITQTWRLTMDCFPCCIELEKGPLQAISSMTYRDMAGATQTISWAAASNGVQRSTDGTLVADLTGPVARITPAFGYTWPVAMPEIAAIAVAFTAGYGDAAADVPEGLRNWILMRVATAYENREEIVAGSISTLPFMDSMLDPFSIVLA